MVSKNFKISKQVTYRANRTGGHVHLAVDFFTEFYTEQRELKRPITDFWNFASVWELWPPKVEQFFRKILHNVLGGLVRGVRCCDGTMY